jgi:hypothetical protein
MALKLWLSAGAFVALTTHLVSFGFMAVKYRTTTPPNILRVGIQNIMVVRH